MPIDKTSPNFELMGRLMRTEPEFEGKAMTKPFKAGGGFSGTALNASYVTAALTAAFGPVGLGWGYEVLAFDDYHPPPRQALGEEGGKAHPSVSFVHIRFWYFPAGCWPASDDAGRDVLVPSGPRAEFHQVGGTPYTGRGDDDIRKKGLTDAISKAASHIGIGIDIHLGLWDDNKWVDQRTAETRETQAANDKAAAVEQRAEVQAKADSLADRIKACTEVMGFAALKAEAVRLKPELARNGMKLEEDTIRDLLAAAQKRVSNRAAA